MRSPIVISSLSSRSCVVGFTSNAFSIAVMDATVWPQEQIPQIRDVMSVMSSWDFP